MQIYVGASGWASVVGVGGSTEEKEKVALGQLGQRPSFDSHSFLTLTGYLPSLSAI